MQDHIDIEVLLYEYLAGLQTLRFNTHDAEDYVASHLGRDGYRQAGGYLCFVQVIEALTAKGRIRPLKRPGKNGLNPPLYRRYQCIQTALRLEPEMRKKLLNHYHPALTLGYYLDNPRDYENDRTYIDAIDAFLKARPDPSSVHSRQAVTIPGASDPIPSAPRASAEHSSPPSNRMEVSVNERSFALFGDEKFLASSAGRRLLQRLGIDYARLHCYETFEPFFYYSLAPREHNDVLIVENKDTFFTLKKHFTSGRHHWGGKNFRLLIYGEGKKILSSFAYFPELTDFHSKENQFYYFGDLDPEGITIFEGLAQRYPQFRFTPFQLFYEALLRHAHRAPRLKTTQKVKREDLEHFLSRFPAELARTMQELLAEGRYLPQEALDFAYFAGEEDASLGRHR